MTFDEYGNPLVTIWFPQKFREVLSELKQGDVTVGIKRFHKKRSLDANAYAWALMDKIAAAIDLPKTDLYRQYIRNVGGASEIICAPQKAVEKICRDWEAGEGRIGWQTEVFPSKIDGCSNIILYEGSSVFDSAQMRRLLELIQEDCRSLGIETDTPEEIEQRLERWTDK
jgi:hypothetical protein